MPAETITSLDAWIPAIVAFGIIAGAINGVMTAIKSALKNTAVDKASWYYRSLPLLPPFLGACTSPLIGPSITPVEFDLGIRIMAGILMGSLSTNIYAVWETNVKRVRSPDTSGDDTLEL
jgi:hypothetical protein